MFLSWLHFFTTQDAESQIKSTSYVTVYVALTCWLQKQITILESCTLMSRSGLSKRRHFLLVAACIEKAVAHKYVDGKENSVFTATPQTSATSSIGQGDTIIRGTFLYVSFKPKSAEMTMNVSCFVFNSFSVEGNINVFHYH
jgi:hypothetical protein